ncbi:MAG: ATP-dependent Clp protease proteolytic subunit [Candidatus Hydrogenedentes bacterium]|nr:ATP-dependent Clp protease proteolytic subunit [Candidatus Hydrogenedentota bacterium]
MLYKSQNEEPEICEEEEKTPEKSDLTIQLLKNRVVIISGEITQELAEKAIAQLLLLDYKSQDPITVYICSPGGHVDSGFAIHDIMRFIKSPITTIGVGWVASIAVPIMMGAPKERRLALPHTRFLIHQPSGGAGGQAADIRIEAQEILKVRERINKLLAEETGHPIEKIAKDSDRNFWMTAQDALEYGLISKIIQKRDELC